MRHTSEEASYYERTVRQDEAFRNRAYKYHPELFTGAASTLEESKPEPKPTAPPPVRFKRMPRAKLTVAIKNPHTGAVRHAPAGIYASRQFEVALNNICLKHELPVEEILTKRRIPHVVAARKELIQILYANNWGIAQIARKLGVDHTTTRHSISPQRRANRKART